MFRKAVKVKANLSFLESVLCFCAYVGTISAFPWIFVLSCQKPIRNIVKKMRFFEKCSRTSGPPDWAQSVIVIGDAGYGCKDNIKAVQAKDKSGGGVRWFFVFAIARTWKRQDNRSIKNLVQHLPRQNYKRTWIPPLLNSGRRKTFWVYRTTLCLRHIGEVTVVLSKKRSVTWARKR